MRSRGLPLFLIKRPRGFPAALAGREAEGGWDVGHIPAQTGTRHWSFAASWRLGVGMKLGEQCTWEGWL